MGCSHCMEDSTIRGKHMTMDMFKKALDATERIEGMAWMAGVMPQILLSGGECTEHPQIIDFIREVERRGWFTVLISNGMWLNNPYLKRVILKRSRLIFVQVTHDPRFYPTKPPTVEDKRIGYKPMLEQLMPLGRATHGNAPKVGLPSQKIPMSFNLRSMTRSLGSIEAAILMHRQRGMQGKGGVCSPNITEDGVIHAGETRYCFPIGNVDSTNAELTEALINMQCNKCGLVKNLTTEQRAAINET